MKELLRQIIDAVFVTSVKNLSTERQISQAKKKLAQIQKGIEQNSPTANGDKNSEQNNVTTVQKPDVTNLGKPY